MFSKLPLTAGALLLVFLLTLGQAQAADAPTSCVWKVEGAGGTVVYLAGSVHLLREKDHPLPPTYDAAYEDSERVFFEIDAAEAETMANAMRLMQLSMLPGDKTLKDVLKPDTYARLDAYLKERGMGGNPVFDRLNPGMMGLTISSMEALRIGALPHLGVEKIYDTKARKDDKEISALESAEFQVNMLKQIGDKDGDEYINSTLDDLEEIPEQLGKLIDAWKTGKVGVMDEMFNEEYDPDDEFAKIILYDRNANWIPAIEKELARTDGNTMVIVGAGHLVGKGSVIELLERKGYKAKQL